MAYVAAKSTVFSQRCWFGHRDLSCGQSWPGSARGAGAIVAQEWLCSASGAGLAIVAFNVVSMAWQLRCCMYSSHWRGYMVCFSAGGANVGSVAVQL